MAAAAVVVVDGDCILLLFFFCFLPFFDRFDREQSFKVECIP